MHTWAVTTEHRPVPVHTGTADTAAQAWNAAHDAAAAAVRTSSTGRITLNVDGQQATIYPAESGDPVADREATLQAIEAGRVDVVAAHEVAQ